jgi:hypothetical protein
LKDKTRKNSKSLVAKPLFYTNVVGQDSITRFDNKEKKGKKNNKKKNNHKPQ